MADLDDFFAKKDKKKSKLKKFLTTDELVKNLEDITKREPPTSKKPETEITADNDSNRGNEEIIPESNDDEWKEFVEENQKDYTGLKILQLNLSDGEIEQSAGENDDGDFDSENNTNSENFKSTNELGPWKKVTPAEEATHVALQVEKKLYVSPAVRQHNLISLTRLQSRKTAPDITNSEYFPTLGARPEERKKKEIVFEEVRRGSRMQRVQEIAPAAVAATNRFQTLEEDAS